MTFSELCCSKLNEKNNNAILVFPEDKLLSKNPFPNTFSRIIYFLLIHMKISFYCLCLFRFQWKFKYIFNVTIFVVPSGLHNRNVAVGRARPSDPPPRRGIQTTSPHTLFSGLISDAKARNLLSKLKNHTACASSFVPKLYSSSHKSRLDYAPCDAPSTPFPLRALDFPRDLPSISRPCGRHRRTRIFRYRTHSIA